MPSIVQLVARRDAVRAEIAELRNLRPATTKNQVRRLLNVLEEIEDAIDRAVAETEGE